MATSSVPACKAGILALLDAAAGLAAVQTEWAHPGEKIMHESIFMLDAEFTEESVAALRTTPRPHTENYTVPVVVDIVAAGDDARAAEERAYELAGHIENAIRNDPTLGGATTLGARVGGKVPQSYMSDQGRAVSLRVDVVVQARI